MNENLSKYEKYLRSLTPENGVVLDVLSNEFKFNSDKNNIEIFADPTEEYHFLYISHYHPERFFTKSFLQFLTDYSPESVHPFLPDILYLYSPSCR